MKLKRGLSRIWPALYQAKLVRPHMPFWRVVVEARLDRRSKKWPRKFDTAGPPGFGWGRPGGEGAGRAALGLGETGLEALTTDAKKLAPAAGPRKPPAAVARAELGFLPRRDGEAGAEGPSRRDARA